jgi:hypothetical protein
MAVTITVDGTGKFGMTTPTVLSMVLESFSQTETGERVDLNDGTGQPVGSVTVPGRTEMSATLQVGATLSLPTVGTTVSIAGTTFFLTEVSLEETQADYQRINVSGYKKLSS